MRKVKVYALYKGDENICDGTLREIAQATGKRIDFLRWMTYPAYRRRCVNAKKRLMLVELDEG